MKIHQAFGRYIDLSAVAVITGGAPTVGQLLDFKSRPWIARGADLYHVGQLTVQLLTEPVELYAKLPEGYLGPGVVEEVQGRVQREWDSLIEAWKAARS